uniref:mRNA capping enzyme adenylation domain-containing protein n=1 Tax=viral metagenome TaxID=1070528 RepID=A0A6C0L2D2_9ZZZZ|tara:strand:+ start:6567 stop:7520 length:954 start_codon:yes stop_codon:yes gene_type:complete
MDPKHMTRTSFCDKEIDNVTDNDMKKYILDNMNIKTNMRYDMRYAKIFNEQYRKNLNNPHILCLKSSGTPYLLYLTQINDTNYCFLIDKKVKDGYTYPKIFIVHYRFSPELFQGTLFEVELTRDKQQEWCLIIGDIYTHSGISLKNTQIHDRMNKCIQIMEEKYIDDSFCNVCPIIIKKYFDLGELETVMNEFIPNLPYRVRGFYFIPLKTNYSKILYLMKEGDYKKANSKNKKYISFRIIKTVKPDVYELYLYNEQKTTIHKHSYATIPNIQTSEWVKKLVDDKDECYVECSYNPIFKKWAPMKESFGADTVIDVK